MPKGGVKVKKIQQKDPKIAEMFSQMVGAEGMVNLDICYPKYCNIKKETKGTLGMIDLLLKCNFIRVYTEFDDSLEEMNKFLQESKKEFDEIFCVDTEKIDQFENIQLISDDDKKKFSSDYENMKKSNLVNSLIVICDNLIKYRVKLSEIETNKDQNEVVNSVGKFFINMSGMEFCPFPFTDFNIKRLFILLSTDGDVDNNLTPEENKKLKEKYNEKIYYILLIVYKIYIKTYEIYKIISSPDVDINEFVDVIMNNIDQVKKRIPRCKQAFKKIEESVHLLKDNFGNYYKDFLTTKNNTIIMENFIIDVAKESNPSPELTRQFREIIKFYQEAAKNQIKDPRLKMLFEKVNENITALERHTNIKKAENDEKNKNTDNPDDTTQTDDTSQSDSDYESDTSNDSGEENLKKQQEKNMQKSVDELTNEFKQFKKK